MLESRHLPSIRRAIFFAQWTFSGSTIKPRDIDFSSIDQSSEELDLNEREIDIPSLRFYRSDSDRKRCRFMIGKIQL